MIWIIDQSVLLMSLQTYPLGVQRLSQTLWWSGHPKAINKTLMLRHLLVLHPQQKHGYPKMIWKGYMTPFYHGRFGYSTHVISKQQHVGRYNKKKPQPLLKTIQSPPPHTGDPRPSHTCETKNTQTQRGPHKRCETKQGQQEIISGNIFWLRCYLSRTTDVPPKGPFQQEKDPLPIPIYQGTC